MATIGDLRNKINIGKEYELIRACGLCRHLITDDSPLLHEVNKTHRLKINFRIADFSNHPISKTKAFVEWRTVEPVESLPHKIVNLDSFLSTHVLTLSEINFTVKDVLRAGSHYYGGVYSGRPKDNEHFLNILNATSGSKENLSLKAIRSICKVVLKSMEPLEIEIIGRAPTGGFSPQS